MVLQASVFHRERSVCQGQAPADSQCIGVGSAGSNGQPESNSWPCSVISTCCSSLTPSRALNALAGLGRPWRIVYTSQSPTGIVIAIDRGLAVTVVDDRTKPPGWAVLGEAQGLPGLPGADVEVHRSPTIAHPVVDDLIALLRETFSATPEMR